MVVKLLCLKRHSNCNQDSDVGSVNFFDLTLLMED
jgi:hypothetical protein